MSGGSLTNFPFALSEVEGHCGTCFDFVQHERPDGSGARS